MSLNVDFRAREASRENIRDHHGYASSSGHGRMDLLFMLQDIVVLNPLSLSIAAHTHGSR